MRPVVSVIMPALNAMSYIGTALDSLLCQSLRDLEVIVVDNGSTDSTVEIVREFARRDKRIHATVSSEIRGAAAARNAGLDLARGVWVAPVDADDACAPARFARLVAAAERRDADLLADNVVMVSFPDREWLEIAVASDSGLFERPLSLTEFLERDAPNQFTLGQLKPIIRRDFLLRHGIKYRADLRVGEDFALYTDCLLSDATFYLIDEPMYFYAIRAGSLCWTAYSIEEALLLNRSYFEHPLVRARPTLGAAFARRGAKFRQQQSYKTFADALKAGNFGTAVRSFRQVCEHPGQLSAQLYSAAHRRMFGERSPFRGQIR